MKVSITSIPSLPNGQQQSIEKKLASYDSSKTSLKMKRQFDFGIAVLICVFFSPILLSVALLLMLVQGRPILIRHHRVGRNGRLFPCLKFRTMVTNPDAVLQAHLAVTAEARAEWAAARKLKNDPRVTRLGQVMRKMSIDELPQVVNVMRGEMSLVGPRPIVLDEVPFYGSNIDLYHSVRPGLTGSWQVGGRSDVSYPRRVQMDVDYVKNWTFKRDLVILAKTVPAVLKAHGSC